MSMRLRMPFALLAALVVVLFSAGPALADPEGAGTSEGGTEDSITGSLAGLTTSGSADTSDAASSETTTTDAPRTTARDFAAAEVTTVITTITITQTGGGSTTATATGGGSTTSSGSTSSGSTTSSSGNPGTCIAGVVQKLITDLQAALGANGEELADSIAAILANPANLPAFLEGLPDLLAEQGEDLSTEGELLLTKAGQDLQKCLPTPPAGGAGTQAPKPSQASGTYTPPAQQAAFTYKNCDEARAYGAAPVYAGQYGYGPHLDSDHDGIGCEEEVAVYVAQPVAYADSGKLAYTGVTVQPLVAWGAALVLAGGWLILSGRRRA